MEQGQKRPKQYVVIDIAELNRQLNEAAECVVLDCKNRVPSPDSMCGGCFFGCLTGETVWDPERKGHVRQER